MICDPVFRNFLITELVRVRFEFEILDLNDQV